MIDFNFGISLDALDAIEPDVLRIWRNDPRIRRFCRQYDLLPKEAHLKWYDRHCDEYEKDRMYAVVDAKTAKGIGICGLTNFDSHNRNTEFSLYINPDLHTQGYGGMALKTLFTHGFENLGLEVIWGETFSFNAGAQHLFQKIGMKVDGIRRSFYFREGKFHDALIYSVLREEWRP